jgi:hypothetical protein
VKYVKYEYLPAFRLSLSLVVLFLVLLVLKKK